MENSIINIPTELDIYDKGTEILCCGTCRHDEDEKNTTNPEDLFNGA